ncbi:MAG TPA: hypothetical protein VFR09_02905 [Alphaproteobacteria bacterium]|nr:hypothetical protein [Alphaproteobacteria bacterium]
MSTRAQTLIFRSVLTAVLCRSLAQPADARPRSGGGSSSSSGGSTSTGSSGSTTPTPPTVTATQAVPAAAFLDSLGVNTHFNFNTNGDAYANVATIESELEYAGFTHARDAITGHWPLAILQKVHADTGIKFDLVVDPSDYSTELTDFRANATNGLIGEVEGPNEIDNWPVTYNGKTGPAAAAAFQKQFYTDMKGTASTSSIPVDSLTVANGVYTGIGNIGPYCDYSGAHIYTQYGGTGPMLDAIEWSVAVALTDTPSKPSVITEFGWWTQPMSGGVSQAVQAKSALNFFFDAYKFGTHRSFIYELNDEYTDPKNTTIERHFGLFQSNGVAKTAATAMHNMTAMLYDPTPTAKPGSIPMTISTSLLGSVSSLLMQRGDGVYILALWQDATLWDNNLLKALTVNNVQALVNFGITGKVVQVYDPMVGISPTNNYANIGGATFMVPDHPIFVFIQQ